MKIRKNLSLILSLIFLLISCDIDLPNFTIDYNKNLYMNSNLFYNYFKPKYLIDTYSLIVITNEQALKYSLSTELVLSVIMQESGFDPSAVSKAGALGLMQLMPTTIDHINQVTDIKISDPFNPRQNIAGGTWYLRYLYNKFDNYSETERLKFALASYNSGFYRVKNSISMAVNQKKEINDKYNERSIKWEDVSKYLPAETQNFVPSVLSHYKKFSNPKIEIRKEIKKINNKNINMVNIKNHSSFPIVLRDWKIYNKNFIYKFKPSTIILPKKKSEFIFKR